MPRRSFSAHRDHEPTPNPSQEGNSQDADRCLLPSSEGSGVGRFMENVVSEIGAVTRALIAEKMK